MEMYSLVIPLNEYERLKKIEALLDERVFDTFINDIRALLYHGDAKCLDSRPSYNKAVEAVLSVLDNKHYLLKDKQA